MDRKEYLEKFMQLVNSGATTLEYRRVLRLFPKQIKAHLDQLPQLRAELKALREAETKKEEMLQRLAKARELKKERRLKEKEEEDEEKRKRRDVDAEPSPPFGDAMGHRKDSGEDA